MTRRKFFLGGSRHKNSELELIYQSATEISITSSLSTSRSQRESGDPPTERTIDAVTPKTLKLGGNDYGRAFKRGVASFRFIFKAPAALVGKIKEKYTVWKDGALLADIRVSDFFVGNQLIMRVNVTPVNSRRRHNFKPSVGFVDRLHTPVEEEREARER